MILSKRLEKICEIMPQVDTVIDVGCDHGYLEELIFKTGKAKFVIATDISEKSLEKTKIRAKKLNLNNIEFVCADGLQFKSQRKSNLAIIAGIGGIETANILKNNKIQDVTEFILVPVQNSVYVRKFLIDENYEVIYDETLFERGKYYSVIYCKKSNKTNIKSYRFGISDLNNFGEDFERFVNRELKNLQFLDKLNEDKVDAEKQKYKKQLEQIKEKIKCKKC